MSEKEIHAVLQSTDLYAVLQVSQEFSEEHLKKNYKKVR